MEARLNGILGLRSEGTPNTVNPSEERLRVKMDSMPMYNSLFVGLGTGVVLVYCVVSPGGNHKDQYACNAFVKLFLLFLNIIPSDEMFSWLVTAIRSDTEEE
ncbi:hypothetical protein GH714_008878 [Hevea brasiliensis]|uniref:Uncharacterized protein n=1 Tax=Hevea brasiliensis TaxID=3981 RepID=A0A6A6NG92_HEVBR|nr:hypothetical protein GH714_008878 [Hevea brasiliensis]